MSKDSNCAATTSPRTMPANERSSVDRWLVVESIVSEDPCAIHHVRAALISQQPCHPQGLRWLIEQLKSGGHRADYASSVLIELAESGLI